MQVEESTPTTPLRPTRAGFVRGLPLTMPIEEVIERGREAGIELQPSDIHAARYYMRQAAAAEASSIPQQLLLGGTFVTKREPGRGNGAAGKSAGAASGQSDQSDQADQADRADQSDQADQADHAETFDLAEHASAEAPVRKRRGRGRTKAVEPQRARTTRANHANHANRANRANRANQPSSTKLQSRLQARLRNATFRDTLREVTERDEKATIGKALDSAAKGRTKRAAKSAESIEDELRHIALRIGTQRVREILDAMEALAVRA